MVTVNSWGSTIPVAESQGGTSESAYVAGDMLYASATNVLSRRAIATNGDVWTLVSGLPDWATPAGGGGAWTWVASTTISNDATISFIGLTATSYKFIIERLLPVTDASDLEFVVSNNNGSSYAAVDYQYAGTYTVPSDVPGGFDSTSATHIQLNSGVPSLGNASGEFGYNAEFIISNIANASYPLSLHGTGQYQDDSGGDIVSVTFGGVSADDTDGGSTLDVDAVRFRMDSGNLNTGVIHQCSLVTS